MQFTKANWWRGIQLGALGLSCVVVVAFLRFHLTQAGEEFRRDFARQSFVELTRGDSFALARKLAALAKSESFACVVGRKGGVAFFEERNGRCTPGLFTVVQQVREVNHQLELEFAMRLSRPLLWGLLAFLAIQGLLAGSVVWSQRRLHRLELQRELDLAVLARQVAHDLRSPLAVIRALEDTPGSASLRKRAINRLFRLVDHLQGEAPAGGVQTPLAELIALGVQEKEIEWNANVPVEWASDVGALLLPGPAHEWRGVLSNLLNNAFEASPSREGVSLRVERGGRGVRISVVDHGKGVPRALLPRLGTEGATQGKEKGKGLGLYLAKTTAEAYGGRLEVRSEEGRGTTVTLSLPCQEAKSVVLVEDDQDLADMWKRVAEKRGLTLQHYASVAEFEAARDGLPKATPIYLDLELQGDPAAGRALGQSLHRLGYTEIHVATGNAPERVGSLPWAKAVIGKEPPWI